MSDWSPSKPRWPNQDDTQCLPWVPGEPPLIRSRCNIFMPHLWSILQLTLHYHHPPPISLKWHHYSAVEANKMLDWIWLKPMPIGSRLQHLHARTTSTIQLTLKISCFAIVWISKWLFPIWTTTGNSNYILQQRQYLPTLTAATTAQKVRRKIGQRHHRHHYRSHPPQWTPHPLSTHHHHSQQQAHRRGRMFYSSYEKENKAATIDLIPDDTTRRWPSLHPSMYSIAAWKKIMVACLHTLKQALSNRNSRQSCRQRLLALPPAKKDETGRTLPFSSTWRRMRRNSHTSTTPTCANAIRNSANWWDPSRTTLQTITTLPPL